MPGMEDAVECLRLVGRLCDHARELVFAQALVGPQVDATTGSNRADAVFGLQRIADLAYGESILIDPYLSDTMSPEHVRITSLVARPELLSFVDVVASTHAHVDSLDPGTLPELLAGDAAFVCASGSEDVAAARAGRPPDASLAPGEAESFGGFVVCAIPAYHEGAPEAVGYVVRNGAYAFYHAGDSRRVQGMAEAVAPHGVDIAFVPICGRNGVMNGADAARLAYECGTQVAIPGHYEMFRDDTAGPSRFVAECVRLGQEYRLPRVGERVTIDYGY